MPPLPIFGEKTAWFAFKTADAERVRDLVFAYGSYRPVSWDAGVEASYDGAVLVTPPIDGFVLSTSQDWLEWWTNGEASTRASEWADPLGCEIQYYVSDRSVGRFGWGRVDEDFEVRELLKHDGELVTTLGAITTAERDLADAFVRSTNGEICANQLAELRAELLRARDAGHVPLAGSAGTLYRGPLVAADEVPIVAALLVGVGPDDVARRWSIDPNQLEDRDAATVPGTCWCGSF